MSNLSLLYPAHTFQSSLSIIYILIMPEVNLILFFLHSLFACWKPSLLSKTNPKTPLWQLCLVIQLNVICSSLNTQRPLLPTYPFYGSLFCITAACIVGFSLTRDCTLCLNKNPNLLVSIPFIGSFMVPETNLVINYYLLINKKS